MWFIFNLVKIIKYGLDIFLYKETAELYYEFRPRKLGLIGKLKKKIKYPCLRSISHKA